MNLNIYSEGEMISHKGKNTNESYLEHSTSSLHLQSKDKRTGKKS